MESIGVIGTGRLGLCMALCLEDAGYTVYGMDNNEDIMQQIQTKTMFSFEPFVNEMLKNSKRLFMIRTYQDIFEKCNILFVVVPTPSKQDGTYDHKHIDDIVEQVGALGLQPVQKVLVISCTTMPEYCATIQEKLRPYNISVCYNPGFTAQGDIIRGFKKPDIVLIGCDDMAIGETVTDVYKRVCMDNNVEMKAPSICQMSLTEAEITKLSLNCFITMKIAYANMIGDLVKRAGGDPYTVLSAIGHDSRVGNKCLKWGYGYGGPSFPRDNIALQRYSERKDIYLRLSEATNAANIDHLKEMLQDISNTHSRDQEYVFEYITYKPNTIILEESFPLKLAIALQKEGYKVRIIESTVVIRMLKQQYGDIFIYEDSRPIV